MYDGYYVYMEDGDLWLGFSPEPFDEGDPVVGLGDVMDVPSILAAIRKHKEEN